MKYRVEIREQAGSRDRFAPPGSTYELGIAIAQLRHAYKQIVNGEVRDWQSFAKGLLAPQIERLERFHQTLIPPSDAKSNPDCPHSTGCCAGLTCTRPADAKDNPNCPHERWPGDPIACGCKTETVLLAEAPEPDLFAIVNQGVPRPNH